MAKWQHEGEMAKWQHVGEMAKWQHAGPKIIRTHAQYSHKVNSAFHSLCGIGKMISRTDRQPYG